MANIAIYKFNSGTDVLPIFNESYEYTYIDEANNDGTVTRTITSDSVPTSISFDSLSGLVEVNYIDTTSINDLSYLFNDCVDLTSVDLYNINTANVTNMSYMFAGCSGLLSIDLGGLNTASTLDMTGMFKGCTGLFSIDIKNLNTAKVTSMNSMFQNCEGLSTVDMTGMNISSLINMGYMFDGCTNLLSVVLKGLNLNSGVTLNNIIDDCIVLNVVNMDNCSIEDINMIINALPTKTANENQAKLKVNNIDISGINSSTLEAKNWNLASYEIVLRYKFDRSVYANVIPTFDSAFTDYVVIDEAIVGNIVTRAIGHENLKPKRVYFGSDYVDPATMVPKCNALREVLYLDASSLIDVRGMFRYCRYLESVDVTGWVTNKVTSLWDVFSLCTRLKTVTGLETWDTSNVISMNAMFHRCENLTSIDVSNFSTGKVTDVAYMFAGCYVLPSLDLSNWDMANVNTLYVMFENCGTLASIGNIANWDTGNVINMSLTFKGCNDLTSLDLSNWDTSKVTTMAGMFKNCYSLQSINVSNWDTSRVTDMSYMFGIDNDVVYQKRMVLTEITGLANFDTSKVNTMSGMFQCCERINTALKGIEGWDVGNVTSMSIMFHRCGALNSLDLSRWNVSKVSTMDRMFRDCYFLRTLNTSNWVTSNLGYTGEMFYYCQSLESLDVGTWVMNRVTGMQGMFFHCNGLRTINGIENWNTPVLQRIDSMFHTCSSLTSLDLSGWTTNRVTSMWQLFNGATNIQSINLSNWNLSSATSLSSVFNGCKKLSELNISGWNTGTITNMINMFYDCNSLTSLDVSNWDTSKVTDMTNMFYNCSSLTSLDVSKWDTSNVTRMKCMFQNCKLLTTIDVSNFIMDNVYTVSGMFYDCENVLSLDVSNWNTDSLLHMNSVFSGCMMISSIDLSRWNTSKVEAIGDLLDGCMSLKTINFNNLNINRDNLSTNDITSDIIPDKMFINDINTLKLLIETTDVRDRSGLEAGILVTPIKDIDENTLQVLEERNWIVRNLVAQYTFDAMTNENTIPVFNDGFNENEYEIVDTVTEDQINTIDFIWEVGCIDGSNGNNMYNTDTALTRTQQFILISPNTTYEINGDLIRSTRLHFDWYDERKNYISQNYIEATANKIVSPVNARYLRLWYNKNEIVGDIVLSSKIVNRTIETVNGLLPTKMIFGYRSDADAQVDYPAHGISSRSSSLLEISSLDTSNLITAVDMFRHCNRLEKINADKWVNNYIEHMDCMFQGCSVINEIDLTNFVTARTTTIHGMFADCHSTKTINTTGWDTSNVTNMQYLFCICNQLTTIIGIDKWNTSQVTAMHWMFSYCNSLTTVDVSKWNTSNVETMHQMFEHCTALTTVDVSKWNVNKVGNFSLMFQYCENLTSIDVSKWNINTTYDINISHMFEQCGELKTINVGNWNVEKVKHFDCLFNNCKKLTTIGDVSNWNTSNAISFFALFHGCASLTTLDVSDWDTSNVTNMYGVFFNCKNLTSIDVSDWDTSKVTDMHAIFADCPKLKSLDLTKWDTSCLKTATAMFWQSTGLTTLDLRSFDMSNVNDISGMFDVKSSNLTTLDISNWVLKPDVVISEINEPNLQYIKCNNNSTINILIPALPDRTGKDAGKILVSNTEGLDISAMTAKNWTAVTIEQCITIAEYKYDESRWNNFIPTFNDDFNGYFVIDNYVDTQNMIILDRTFYANNIVTRKIISIENKPSLIRFGNVMNGPAELYTKADSLLSIESLDISNLTSADSLFRKCTYLKSINTENWDTSEITDMYCMFADCQALTSLDVSHFDTSKVWRLLHMFTCCISLETVDVSNWDVGSVTQAQYMFNGCINLSSLNLSNWDVRSIAHFNDAFEGCTNLTTIGDTSGWNTASLVSTSNMFKNCSSLTSINASNWNMSKVTSTESMFNKCTNLTTIGDTSGWLTYALTSMDYMFERCAKLQSIDVSNWYTANVTKMNMVFFDCISLTSLDLSRWSVSKATSFHGLFTNCNKLTTIGDISGWNTGNVKSLAHMFSGCELLTSLNLSNWDVSNVTDMTHTFSYCNNLTTIGDVTNWNTSKVTNMSNMFNHCNSLTTINVSKWNTSNVLNMSFMFNYCRALTSLDVSNWDTSNVTDMTTMFYHCDKLTTIGNVSNWDTSKVTNMATMFGENASLQSLDVSNWNTSKVTSMFGMFFGCYALTSLDVSNFDTSAIVNMTAMLGQMHNIKTLNLNNIKAEYSKAVHSDDDRFMSNAVNLEKIYLNDLDTLNTVLRYIVNRTGKTPGKIVTSIRNKIPAETLNALTAKNWEIVDMLIHYRFNPDVYENLLPDGIKAEDYNIIDNEHVITIDELFWQSGILNTNGAEATDANYAGAARSAYISVIPSLTYEFDIDYCQVYWYDKNKVCISAAGLYGTNDGATNGNKCLAPQNAKFMRIYRTVGVNKDAVIRARYIDRIIENVNGLSPHALIFGLNAQGTAGPKQECLLEVLECNMSTITLATAMFGRCYKLKKCIVTNVTNRLNSIQQMFYACISLTSIDVSTWDTSNVTDHGFQGAFQSCNNLVEIKGLENFDTSKAKNMANMFGGDVILLNVNGIENWDISGVNNLNGMFDGCSKLQSINVSNWDTSNVTTMNTLFRNCYNLTNLDISNWNTSKVTDMSYMFSQCKSLTSLDISDWDTSNVVMTVEMFRNCQLLTTLDVSKWDIGKVTQMRGMFYECKSLTSLDLSNWVIHPNNKNFLYLFAFCEKLQNIKGLEKWDVSNVEGLHQTFFYCRSLQSLNIGNWDVSNVDDFLGTFAMCTSLKHLDLHNWNPRGFNSNNAVKNMFGFGNPAENMVSIDISNFDFSTITDNSLLGTNLFNATKLKYIKCNKPASINKLLSNTTNLPTRTVDNPGYLICKGDVSQINKSILRDKNWNVVSADQLNVVAKYKYDRSIYADLIPNYQSDSYYGFVEDESIEGNIVTRVIEHIDGVLPQHMEFGTRKYMEDGTPREKSLLEVIKLDTRNLVSLFGTFTRCSNLTKVHDITTWDTSKVRDLQCMFYGTNVTSLDLSNFNTSNVTTSWAMFAGCNYLTSVNVSNWDMCKNNSINQMFTGCYALTEIIGISEWNTENITDIRGVFYNCYNLLSLDVSRWNTSNVTNMSCTFFNCKKLTTIDVSNWDTSKVTNMESLFNECWEITSLDVSGFDTSKVTDMSAMFYNCKKLTAIDVSNWDTSKVVNMREIFLNCNNLTSLDVSNWNTSQVVSMQNLFRGCTNIKTVDVSNWDLSNTTTIHGMFCGSGIETVDVSKWNTSKVTDFNWLFNNCQSLTSLDVSNWDTSQVVGMRAVFWNCTKVPVLDVSNWNTSKVIDTYAMFDACYELKELDVSNWDTSNVTNMYAMFWNCNSLTSLDLSNFDTSNVTQIGSLFNYARDLKEINLNNIVIDRKSTDITTIFPNCYNVEKIYVNSLDTLSVVILNMCNRTGKTPGKIVTPLRNEIPEDYLAQITAKNWEIVDIVAQYKFDANVYENLIPAFNAEFTEDKYTVIDNVSEIVLTNLLWNSPGVIDVNGGSIVFTANYPRAITTDFIHAIPNVNYIVEKGIDLSLDPNYEGIGYENAVNIAFYDKNKQFINLLVDVPSAIAPSNAAYMRVCTDEQDWDDQGINLEDCKITAKIINRTIESVNGDLPTMMRFGNVNAPDEPANNSLLAVLDANMSNITNMRNMFDHCNRVTKINTANWDVSKVTDMEAAFAQCNSLTTLDVSNWDVSNVTNLYAMFQNCKKLTSLDLSKWNTSNVISTSHLFYNCNKLTTIGDIGNWDTSKVNNMRFMFAECHKLSAINVSNFNTSSVFSMKQMFYKCLAITELNVSNFDTSNVTDMNTMFHDCNNLTKIDVSGFDTSKVTDMYAMFHSTGLKTINLSNFDFSKVISAESLIGTAGMYTNINNNLTNVQLPDSDLPDSIPNFIANRSQLKYIKCNSKNNIVKLVNILPTRTVADPGKILTNIPLTEFSDIVVETLATKNWAISNEQLKVVAKYKFAKDIRRSLIPAFNGGYTNYFVDDEYLDNEDLTGRFDAKLNEGYTISAENIVTRTISILEDGTLPTSIRFGSNLDHGGATGKELCLLSIEELDISGVKSLYRLFRSCRNLKYIGGIENWDVSRINNIEAFITNTLIPSLDLSRWDTSNFTNVTWAFAGNYNMTALNVSTWKTSKMRNIDCMFSGCKNLLSLDVSNWDVSNVTSMYATFKECNVLTSLDLSRWQIGNLSKLNDTFTECHNLTTIGDTGNWNTSKVTTMQNMFKNCRSLTAINVSNWDVSSVNYLNWVFQGCKSLTELDVSGWDTRNATAMDGIFCDCTNITELDVSNFDTSKATGISHMFNSCINLSSIDVSNWNTSSAKSIVGIFNNCPKLIKVDVSGWDTSNVTSMNNAFYLNGNNHIVNLNNIVINEGTGIDKIFMGTTPCLAKLYVNNIDTLQVLVSKLPDRSSKTTGRIIMPNKDQVSAETVALLAGKNWHLGNLIASYKYDSNIYEDLIPEFNSSFGMDKYIVVDTNDSKGVITRNIEDVDGTMPTVVMFGSWEDTIEPKSLLHVLDMNTNNITRMDSMFHYCENLISVNMQNWDTSNVTNMGYMFHECYNLTSIDVSNFNTSNVTNMGFMFCNCYKLTSLDVSNFNTSKVTTMSYMFWQCQANILDVSNFDTSNVTNMYGMFCNCHHLTSLDVSNFITSNVTNMEAMFRECDNLTSLDLSNFDTNNVTNMDNMLLYNINLNKITTNDLNTTNSIIPLLPNRTGKEAGTLVYYDIDPALLDTPTLQAKNWNLSYEPILAKYIFDSNVYDNLLPRGGSSLVCDIIDDVKSDGRVVRTVKYKNSSYIVKWIGFGVSSGGTDITAQESLLSVLYMDVNSNVNSLNNAFASCKNLKYINTRNWNTCNVTDMYCAFYLCNKLPYLNVSNFNTEKVERFDNTFMGCYNMLLEGYENLDTSNATTIEGMFGGCGRHTMKEFNLSNYDMSKVVDVDKLFYGCTKVEAINLDNFILNDDMSKTTIFKECHELIRISSNNCSTETINNIISELPDRTGKEYGKIYIINHDEIELINRDVLEAKNWKAVIRGGNIKAVHIPNELFQSLGLGNVMVKHVHIGERFL